MPVCVFGDFWSGLWLRQNLSFYSLLRFCELGIAQCSFLLGLRWLLPLQIPSLKMSLSSVTFCISSWNRKRSLTRITTRSVGFDLDGSSFQSSLIWNLLLFNASRICIHRVIVIEFCDLIHFKIWPHLETWHVSEHKFLSIIYFFNVQGFP